MSSKIFKYVIPTEDRASVDIPKDSAFLDIQVQGNKTVVWAVVDPDSDIESVVFRVLPTGAELEVPEGKYVNYLGTVQTLTQSNDPFVLHFFTEEDDA